MRGDCKHVAASPAVSNTEYTVFVILKFPNPSPSDCGDDEIVQLHFDDQYIDVITSIKSMESMECIY